MKRLSLLLAVALFAATSLFAQSKLSNYSRIVINNAKADAQTQADFGIKRINGIQMVSAFVTFNDAIDASLITKYGGTVQSEFPANRIVTALLPLAALEPLSREEGIFYIEAAEKVEPQMDKARTASNAERMINGEEPLSQSYLGSGVIVGIIDQGFQLDHPNFWNASHDRYRIKAFWNQEEEGRGGNGYSYGTFYMDSASIINKKYDYYATNANLDHATHVLGIAAGADHSMNYYGIAQEADIVAVSTFGNTGITDAAKWIFHYADSLHKPCVINLSMGTVAGPHDGTSSTNAIIDSLVSPGHLFVCSAGNEGSAALHLNKTFAQPDTLRTILKFQTQASAMHVDMWGEVGTDFSAQFVVMDNATNTLYYESGFHSLTSPKDSFSVTQGSKTLFEVTCESEVSSINHKGNERWTIDVKEPIGNLVPGIMVAADSGTVNLWSDNEYFDDNEMEGWTCGDNDMTISNIASSNKAIAVGSYVTRFYIVPMGDLYDISYNSSKGPTADGRTKPEITAPGFYIKSSVTDIADSYDSESTVVGGKTYYYGLMEGTSMAAPYVTGVIAAWLEADSTLDYDGIMDIFRHSSIRDEYTGTNLPDNEWGYGKINAYQGLIYLLGLTADVESVTEHQIVGIYPNPTADEFRIGFASADNNVTVTVVDLSGRAILSRTLGNVSPGQEVAFSLADAPTGIYMVRISGASHTNTYKLVKN